MFFWEVHGYGNPLGTNISPSSRHTWRWLSFSKFEYISWDYIAHLYIKKCHSSVLEIVIYVSLFSFVMDHGPTICRQMMTRQEKFFQHAKNVRGVSFKSGHHSWAPQQIPNVWIHGGSETFLNKEVYPLKLGHFLTGKQVAMPFKVAMPY